jgi:trehalose 6-phosphate synthase
VAAAIAQALSMPLEERKTRHKALFQVLEAADAKPWAESFLAALTKPRSVAGTVARQDRVQA